MAELSDSLRGQVRREFTGELSSERDSCSVSKADIKATVDALDAWLDSNAATINQQIPQPARSNLTTAQKARLLRLVIRKRYLEGV